MNFNSLFNIPLFSPDLIKKISMHFNKNDQIELKSFNDFHKLSTKIIYPSEHYIPSSKEYKGYDLENFLINYIIWKYISKQKAFCYNQKISIAIDNSAPLLVKEAFENITFNSNGLIFELFNQKKEEIKVLLITESSTFFSLEDHFNNVSTHNIEKALISSLIVNKKFASKVGYKPSIDKDNVNAIFYQSASHFPEVELYQKSLCLDHLINLYEKLYNF